MLSVPDKYAIGCTGDNRDVNRVGRPAASDVIKRQFEEYISDRTPRDIARGLNRDGISAPRGSKWNASTINGNLWRGTGILQNKLYGGRLVWNKLRVVKDTDTGRRVSRPNAKSGNRSTCPSWRLLITLSLSKSRRASGSVVSTRLTTIAGHAICWLGSCAVAPADRRCQRTARTNPFAFGFDAPPRRRATHAPIRRPSISI